VWGRQDLAAKGYDTERGWNVSLLAANGTKLWTYDWPTGQGSYPAIWRRATWPPPPPPLTPSPPAVQAQNTPCEPAGGLRRQGVPGRPCC
jgi:hypothetical protein